MLQRIRKFVRHLPLVRHFVAHYLIPSGLYDKAFMNIAIDKSWKARVDDAVQCKDNEFIPRVKDAGLVVRGKQIMHNGIRINLGSYYGVEKAKLMFENKGVHEPQEERAFMEVLKTIKPGSTMIELGSFWAFYSMWFYKEVTNANCYMIEPDAFNIKSGKRNFTLNNMSGRFFQYFIGKASGQGMDGTPSICIDDFVKLNKINFVDILHCDIQGYEYDMLLGSSKLFAENKVGYIFISTHSNDLHSRCLEFLRSKQFIVICHADKNQTYSEDGLIVARAPSYPGIDKLAIALKGVN